MCLGLDGCVWSDREMTNVVTRGKSLLAILLPRTCRGRGAESVHSTPLPNDGRASKWSTRSTVPMPERRNPSRLDGVVLALPRVPRTRKNIRSNVQSAEQSAVDSTAQPRVNHSEHRLCTYFWAFSLTWIVFCLSPSVSISRFASSDPSMLLLAPRNSCSFLVDYKGLLPVWPLSVLTSASD